MPGLISSESESAKILLLGDSGHGKTFAKASLIAYGYKYRGVDTDRGFKILRGLLTDRQHYPYADYMKRHGIDPTEPGRISYIPIDVPIDFQNVRIVRQNRTINYDILAPVSAAAWETVIKLLKEWKDTIDGKTVSYGAITDWDNNTVLDFDTISTLAELAKFWVQDMNGHLGALEDDHGRDTGGAQDLISRLMIKLTSPLVRCNVICTTHIRWVDTTRGAPMTPEQLLRQQKPIDARGWPAVIGAALSPVLPKRWNDSLICRREGNDRNATYRIYTVPRDNTDAKRSVYLEDSYSNETGLAEIFAALRYEDPPTDLLEAFATRRSEKPTASAFGTFNRQSGNTETPTSR